MPPWTLISPASRGIGFALTRKILQTTNAPVVATARKDIESVRKELLDGLDVEQERLKLVECDVLDESSIESASSECKSLFPPSDGHTLHLGLIIPGILYPEKHPAQINADDALLTFRTNTLGPMLMLKHFEPFLPSKRSSQPTKEALQGLPSTAIAALMSARVGSIADNRLGGWYSYRASKAAVNQVVKTFDNHLKTRAGEMAMCVGLHPGTVRTGLSKEFWGSVKKEQLFEAEYSAERLLEVLRHRGDNVEAGRGRCWDWQGKEIPP